MFLRVVYLLVALCTLCACPPNRGGGGGGGGSSINDGVFVEYPTEDSYGYSYGLMILPREEEPVGCAEWEAAGSSSYFGSEDYNFMYGALYVGETLSWETTYQHLYSGDCGYDPYQEDYDLSQIHCHTGVNSTGPDDYVGMEGDTIVVQSFGESSVAGRIEYASGSTETFRLEHCEFPGYYGDDDDVPQGDGEDEERDVRSTGSSNTSPARPAGSQGVRWRLRFR